MTTAGHPTRQRIGHTPSALRARAVRARHPARSLRAVLSVLGCVGALCAALPALAQDPLQDPTLLKEPLAKETVTHERLGISMSTPDGWSRLELTSNSRTVASFIHVQSQSLIEVVGTHLINRDVAKVFFGTFRDALKSANFSEVMPPTAATLGSVSGEQSEYTFEHTGITLRVVIFSFIRDDAAFMLIGYFRNEERDLHLDAMRQLASSFLFS